MINITTLAIRLQYIKVSNKKKKEREKIKRCFYSLTWKFYLTKKDCTSGKLGLSESHHSIRIRYKCTIKKSWVDDYDLTSNLNKHHLSRYRRSHIHIIADLTGITTIQGRNF